MRRAALLSIPVLLAFSCATRTDTAASAATPPVVLTPPEGDCTLQTPLVPGIPGSPGNLIKSPRNPNGESELAFLMRRMVDDLEQARAKLQRGERVDALFPMHRKMRCAWPTNPADRNVQFDAMAVGYLNFVEAFDRAPSKETYNGVVAGCVSCHANTCNGPIPMIQGLIWP